MSQTASTSSTNPSSRSPQAVWAMVLAVILINSGAIFLTTVLEHDITSIDAPIYVATFIGLAVAVYAIVRSAAHHPNMPLVPLAVYAVVEFGIAFFTPVIDNVTTVRFILLITTAAALAGLLLPPGRKS